MQKILILLSFLSFLVMFVVIFFVSESWSKNQYDTELNSIQVILGNEASHRIHQESTTWYQYLFIDSKIEETSYNLFLPESDDVVKQKYPEFFDSHVSPTITKFWIAIKQMILRISLLKSWFFLCLPIVMAAILDGMMIRKVKQHTFGYSSPFRYRFALYLIEVSTILLIIYLTMPFATIANAWVPLVWFLIIATSMSLLMSNLQKRV